MGILSTLKNTVSNRFPRSPVVPEYLGADFTNGLLVRELQWNGSSLDELQSIRLQGTNLPIAPLEWEGEQRIVKEYYPGNVEPAMQILGPRENNIILRGRFKSKRLAPTDDIPGFEDPEELRQQAANLQEYFDAIRLRGNIVELTLGEWRRYGFFERTKFAMRTLADIDYEIEFNVIGFQEPFFNFFANEVQKIPYDVNTALAVNGAYLSQVSLDPDLPTDVFDLLNDAISTLAEAIAVVTNFVDGVLSIADEVESLYNRAIGLCKYLRAQIAQYKRTLASIELTISDAPAALADFEKQTWLMVNSKSIYDLAHQPSQPLDLTTSEQTAAIAQLATFAQDRQKVDVTNRGFPTYQQAQAVTQTLPMDILVWRMLQQFQALNIRPPLRQHVVRRGDTFQKIAYLYYGNAELWAKVYEHNKLDDTDLTDMIGESLEIPSLGSLRTASVTDVNRPSINEFRPTRIGG